VLETALLTLVLIGYVARSHLRNVDWQSELQLWRAAAIASPNSFKTHLSTAYLLYRTDSVANIDLAIREAERAASIIDGKPLPVADVPLNVFAHLGAYYSTKGDQLRRPVADGSLVSTEESRRWHEKAVTALERAVSIDRALNEVHRQRETLRGRRPGEIPDVGDQDVYRNLGIARARLGHYGDAIDAWRYLLHLAPARADTHATLASLYRLAGRNEAALVALHQSLLLDERDQEAAKAIVTLYQELDAGGCAVRLSTRGPELDPACPAVHAHRCRAYGALVGLFESSTQFARAQQLRRQATDAEGCRPEQLAAGWLHRE